MLLILLVCGSGKKLVCGQMNSLSLVERSLMCFVIANQHGKTK